MLFYIWAGLFSYCSKLVLVLVLLSGSKLVAWSWSSCLQLIFFSSAGLAVWSSICSQSWSLCPVLVFLFKVALVLFGAGLVVWSCSCCLVLLLFVACSSCCLELTLLFGAVLILCVAFLLVLLFGTTLYSNQVLGSCWLQLVLLFGVAHVLKAGLVPAGFHTR
jgi:hypothetical protein